MFNKKGETDKQLLDIVEFMLILAVAITLAISLYSFLQKDYYRGYLTEDSALMLSVIEIAPGDVEVNHKFKGLIYDVTFTKDKDIYYYHFSKNSDSAWSSVLHNSKKFEIEPFYYEGKEGLNYKKIGDEITIT